MPFGNSDATYELTDDGKTLTIKGAFYLSEWQEVLYSDSVNPETGDYWFFLNNDFADVTKVEFIGAKLTGSAERMFYDWSSLETLDLSGLDTSSVTNMGYMFSGCSELKNLTFGDSFNTSGVTDMNFMFDGCKALKTLDLSGLDTSSVTNMYMMFSGCSSLENLTFGDSFNTSSVTNMYMMFSGCSKLTNLTFGENFKTSLVTNMGYMFSGCSELTTLDLSGWDTSSVNYMGRMFNGCSKLTTIYVGTSWTTENVASHNDMFSGCEVLVGGKGTVYDPNHINKEYAHVDGDTNDPGYLSESPLSYKFTDNGKTLTISGTFSSDDWQETFYDGDSLRGDFADVTKVEFIGAKMTDSAEGMFANWNNLESANLSGLDTSGVKNMYMMFYGCSSLTNLTFGENFKTSLVMNMSSMFYGCSRLTGLTFGDNFKTSSVTTMSAMFNGCSSLTTLNLSGFNTSGVTDMSCMFFGCRELKTIYVGNSWTTEKVTSDKDMFYDCNVLQGGKGTQYNYECTGKTYARIDAPWDNPGYLSYYDAGTPQTPNEATDAEAGTTTTTTGTVFTHPGAAEISRVDIAITTKTALAGIVDKAFESDVTVKATLSLADNDYTNYDISVKLTGLPDWLKVADGELTKNGKIANGSDPSVAFKLSGTPTEAMTAHDIKLTATVRITGGGNTLLAKGEHTVKLTVNGDENPSGPSDPAVAEPVEFGNSNATYKLTDNGKTLTISGTFSGNDWQRTFNNNGSPKNDFANVTKVEFTNAKMTGSADYMFYSWSNLASANLSGLDTSGVTNMSYMFNGCSKLTTLALSGFNTSGVTTMENMFKGCSSLTSLDLSDFNTSSVTDMSGMFYGCSRLTGLTFGDNFKTLKVTNMGSMFKSCSELTSLDLSNFNTSGVTNMYMMFYGCSSLTNLTFGENFNTSGVTNMSYMFFGCEALTSLALSDFNTSGVTNMSYMFNGCSKLTTLALSGFNTAKVTNMSNMFNGCSSLTTLNLSGWDTSGVTNMSYMFNGCSSLTTLNLSGLDTSSVTIMENMFNDCSSLTALDLSGWDTSGVTTMENMFNDCSSLTALDLSGFNTSLVAYMYGMFYKCSGLKTIYVGNSWTTEKVASNDDMFYDCEALVGGKGTKYDSSITGKTYARVDGLDGNPGYLSRPGDKDVQSVTLEGTSETLNVGETLELTANVQPSTVYDATVTWSVTDGGKVKLYSDKECAIVISNGASAPVKVYPESVKLACA